MSSSVVVPVGKKLVTFWDKNKFTVVKRLSRLETSMGAFELLCRFQWNAQAECPIISLMTVSCSRCIKHQQYNEILWAIAF
jgi:hypothetical protein